MKMLSKQVNLKCVEKLSSPGAPIVIVAALNETEANSKFMQRKKY